MKIYKILERVICYDCGINCDLYEVLSGPMDNRHYFILCGDCIKKINNDDE